MLIIKVTNGLGNQLFQYAFGRCLSIEMNQELFIDQSFYESDDYLSGEFVPKPEWHFKFRLEKYNTKFHKASQDVLRAYSSSKYGRICRFISKKININGLVWSSGRVARQRPGCRSPLDVLVKKKDLYLIGYWANEFYFSKHKSFIIEELTLNSNSLDELDHDLVDILNSRNSISVHIRRGAYVGYYSYWVNLGINYYMNAIDFISNLAENPLIVFFSDDIEWVKANIRCKHDHIFMSRSADYLDLHYMSICKHNIIANSTFSWWGAYLNKNPAKVVVAPKLWFTGRKEQSRYEKGGFIPKDWYKI